MSTYACQTHHIGNVIECTWVFFRQVAYSRREISSRDAQNGVYSDQYVGQYSADGAASLSLPLKSLVIFYIQWKEDPRVRGSLQERCVLTACFLHYFGCVSAFFQMLNLLPFCSWNVIGKSAILTHSLLRSCCRVPIFCNMETIRSSRLVIQ